MIKIFAAPFILLGGKIDIKSICLLGVPSRFPRRLFQPEDVVTGDAVLHCSGNLKQVKTVKRTTQPAINRPKHNAPSALYNLLFRVCLCAIAKCLQTTFYATPVLLLLLLLLSLIFFHATLPQTVSFSFVCYLVTTQTPQKKKPNTLVWQTRQPCYSHLWGTWAAPLWLSLCSWQSGSSVRERRKTWSNSFCSHPTENKETPNESKWSLQYSTQRRWWKNITEMSHSTLIMYRVHPYTHRALQFDYWATERYMHNVLKCTFHSENTKM